MGSRDPEDPASLAELLRADPTWNQGTALALLVFVMLYAPCFVTLVVIRQESGSWKWVAFSIAFNTLLAFGMAVGVYQTYRFSGWTYDDQTYRTRTRHGHSRVYCLGPDGDDPAFYCQLFSIL